MTSLNPLKQKKEFTNDTQVLEILLNICSLYIGRLTYRGVYVCMQNIEMILYGISTLQPILYMYVCLP